MGGEEDDAPNDVSGVDAGRGGTAMPLLVVGAASGEGWPNGVDAGDESEKLGCIVLLEANDCRPGIGGWPPTPNKAMPVVCGAIMLWRKGFEPVA